MKIRFFRKGARQFLPPERRTGKSESVPTILSHPAVPLALGLGLGRKIVPRRLLLVGIVASVMPDIDVLAFRFDIAYSHQLGHRGFTHSLFFAACLGLIAALAAGGLRSGRLKAFGFVFFAGASHGLLDMLTNGGLGIALWWPFSEHRLFFPNQVIEVSPFSLKRFLSGAGDRVLGSELLWVWLPSSTLGAAMAVFRKLASGNFRSGAGLQFEGKPHARNDSGSL
jgi:inner membrane protein